MTSPWKYPVDVKFGKRFVRVATLGSLRHLHNFVSRARDAASGDHTIAPVQLQGMPLRGVNSDALLCAQLPIPHTAEGALPVRATSRVELPHAVSVPGIHPPVSAGRGDFVLLRRWVGGGAPRCVDRGIALFLRVVGCAIH